jgi:hypothetical protein
MELSDTKQFFWGTQGSNTTKNEQLTPAREIWMTERSNLSGPWLPATPVPQLPRSAANQVPYRPEDLANVERVKRNLGNLHSRSARAELQEPPVIICQNDGGSGENDASTNDVQLNDNTGFLPKKRAKPRCVVCD